MPRHLSSNKSSRNRGSVMDCSTPEALAAVAAQCREILQSPAGIAQLRREILEGSPQSFWRTMDLAFGNASRFVEPPKQAEAVDDGPSMAVKVEGLSEAAIRFMMQSDSQGSVRPCQGAQQVRTLTCRAFWAIFPTAILAYSTAPSFLPPPRTQKTGGRWVDHQRGPTRAVAPNSDLESQ
jgi:hypothetical protein